MKKGKGFWAAWRTGGHVPAEDSLRKDVKVMCNLSQGIRDDEDERIILNMHKKGYTSEQIADIVEKSVVEVEAVIQKREPALV